MDFIYGFHLWILYIEFIYGKPESRKPEGWKPEAGRPEAGSRKPEEGPPRVEEGASRVLPRTFPGLLPNFSRSF